MVVGFVTGRARPIRPPGIGHAVQAKIGEITMEVDFLSKALGR
jgi:hypothetical protein